MSSAVPRPPVRLAPGVVASGHEQVSAAAARTLSARGNAFDAIVAAGFASAVCEPALTSLGGGGFLLARASDRRTRLFDFFVDTPGRGRADAGLEPHFFPVTVRFPGSEQVFNAGLGSVATPGTLTGLLHVHAELGRLPLRRVLTPAIEMARDGVALNARQAYFLQLLEPIVTLTPPVRALFAPGGAPLGAGELLRNPDLAAFLEALPGSARSLHAGELAGRVAHDMESGQGLLTRDDLAAYRVIERQPLTATYRGYELLTNGPPSFGGPLIALSLSLLEECAFSHLRFGETAHLSTLAAVLREVEGLRAEGVAEGAPDSSLETARGRLRRFSRGTTHISVADAEHNVASMTNSNGEGSGYVVPGTGILLNNMLGEDDLHPGGFHASPPGLRVASMMAPSLLLHGGQVRLVLGSGGSKRIRSALLQVISNVVDFGLALREAIEAPRVHWDGEVLQVEPGFPAASLEALRRTLPVNVWPSQDVYFGGVHAVEPAGAGAGDPRRGGCALRVE